MLPGAAAAATYLVSTDGELRAAITAANGDGDSSSTIVMTASFATASGQLPVPTKSITIDTQGFTLSGPANSGVPITGTGAVRTLVGTFMGTSGGSSGAGLSIRNGASVTNMGLVQGATASTGNGGAGVDFGGPAAATSLTNHGTIRGGPAAGGIGGVGIFVRSGAGQIINTGTIEGGGAGGSAIVGAATASIDIVNSGIIRAGAGADAIGWSVAPTTGVIRLELQDGSQIFGNVVANATATTDRLRLSGTGFSILDGSIGAAGQYRNFDILEKTGSGTWALTADNTATESWTISQGTLQIGNGGTSGSILGNVANNATLAFDRSDTYIYAGAISGIGAVNQIGTGTTVLTGDNTYDGGTTISAGTLQLGNGGTTGSIIGDVTDNGTLAFDRSDTSTFAGIISGSGVVNQIGTGTTVLTGDSTYAGGTTISAGTLQLGNGGTSGSITGNVTNNGNLAFDRSNEATFAGTISGSGAVVQQGSGTTILTADSSYAGGTTISAGTLQLGNGGMSGSITGNVTNNGTLAFDRSNGLILAGIISGSGGVVQQGSSTTALTGDNTYSGGTTISAGTLQLGNRGTSGSITGDVTNNGTLAFYRTDNYTLPAPSPAAVR
ncbi:autotransporter-associated beta strand repeat-containing protein [Mesorhizobium sp. 128a]